LLICNNSFAWNTASVTREYKAGEPQRIEDAASILCHEMSDEAAFGHTRQHMIWILEGYYEKLKKHPKDKDLMTKIKVLEKALEHEECRKYGID